MTRKRDWKKLAGTGVVMAALAVVPLIYSSILTDANIDPTGSLSTVPAAVVNEDRGASGPDGEPLDAGDELADTLVTRDEDNNFDWAQMDAAEAKQRLADGDVYAVLTVPGDFSEKIVSVGDDDPEQAEAAKLSVQTNDGLNMISGNIASTIGGAVTDSLRTEVSEQYLEKIYLGFTDVHSSLVDAADGAGQLADGADSAASGSGELVVGLGELRDGTAQLAIGASTLASSADTAARGAGTLSAGLDELRDKTKTLPDQAGRLDGGAQQVAAGADTLSDRVDGAVAALKPAVDRANRIAGEVSDALHDADELSGDAQEIGDGLADAVDGAAGVKDGLDAFGVDLGDLGDSSTDVQERIASLIADYDSMSDEERKAALGEIQGGADDIVSGVGTVSGAVDGIRGDADKVAAVKDLQSKAADLGDGLEGMSLRAGHLGDDFDAAVSKLHDKVDQVGAAVDGVHRLSDGADQVADGTAQLAAQAGPLADGIAQAADGAAQLADGGARLARGAHALSTGAGTAASGADSAETGASALDDGIGKLADGSGDLRDGLEDGVDQVPTYTDGQARHLGSVSADQVRLDATRENEVAGYGAGLAPYFLSLALWVGAMSFYMMASAINARALARRLPAPLLSLRSLLPGAVMGVIQATIAVLSLHFWVGVAAVDLPGLFALAAFASITFFAVNQALIALLGSPGRFIALLMVVLQVASSGGTYPIETAPAFYQAIHHVLPMTYTVEAFRSMVAGGSIGIGTAYGALSIWLAGALVVSVLAAAIHLRKARANAAPSGAGDAPGPRRQGTPEAGRSAGAAAPAGSPATRSLTAPSLALTAVLERHEQPPSDDDVTGEADASAATETVPAAGPDPDATREVPVPAPDATREASEDDVLATEPDDVAAADEAAGGPEASDADADGPAAGGAATSDADAPGPDADAEKGSADAGRAGGTDAEPQGAPDRPGAEGPEPGGDARGDDADDTEGGAAEEGR